MLLSRNYNGKANFEIEIILRRTPDPNNFATCSCKLLIFQTINLAPRYNSVIFVNFDYQVES